jgi:Spy/CpxP family protein refolding chaperone
MKRFAVPAAAAALLAVVAFAPVFAQESGPPGPGHHRMHGEARLEKHLDELGLDPAQKEKVRAILDASKQARQAQFEQMRAAHEQMRALLDQDAPDEAAVMAQAETLLAVRAELTPEQRAELKTKLQSEGGHHFWKRRGELPPDDRS